MHPHHKPQKKRHRVRNSFLALGAGVVLLIVIVAIAGSNGNGGSQPSAASSAQPSAAHLAQPSSAQAASSTCTSHQCITKDAEQTLPGAVAKDNAVATKAVCYKSTVKPDGNDDYTVDCTVTYSDGNVADGYATVEMAKNYVLFEPSGYGQ